MTQPRKRRIGRKQWGPLIKYLTETMRTSGSERVRMAAALRLADVLTLREQREQLEMRRELRLLAKAGDEPEDTPGNEAARQSAAETVDEFLARIKTTRKQEEIAKDE